MKKKILLSLLCVVMVIGIATGCDKNNEEGTNPSTNNNGEVNNQTGTTDTGKTENNNDVDLIYTFKDPSLPIAFDYPNLKVIEEGTSRIFKNSRFVIAYCRDEKEAELKNIPNELSWKFTNSTDTHMLGEAKSFDITETKEININGVKVLMITGDIIAEGYNDSKYNHPFKGYVFEKDGVIAELIGFIDKESTESTQTDKDNQAEMEKTIDAMIKTLRDDR